MGERNAGARDAAVRAVSRSQMIVQDVVFFVAFALVYGTAGTGAVALARVLRAIGCAGGAGGVALAIAGGIAAVPLVLALAVVPVALVHLLLPPIRPGIYRV